MKAKLILFQVFIFSFFHLFSQTEWVSVQSPVSENLTSLWMTNSGVVIIVTDQGTILRSNDGGETWDTYSYPGFSFSSIGFSNDYKGAIVSSTDVITIFKTEDAGESWEQMTLDGLTEANCIGLANNRGLIAGYYGDFNECYYTNDWGENWFPSYISHISESVFYDVSFRIDYDIANMVGNDGTFYSTIDGGENWSMDFSFPLVDLNAIHNFGVNYGVTVGDGGVAYYTINKWYQHIDLVTNVTENLNGVCAAPGTTKVWAVGDNGTIIFMEYYYLGWAVQSSGTNENLNDIFILDENTGIAVGDNGTILKMQNATSTNEYFTKPSVVVFPNPVYGKCKVVYTVLSGGNVRLRIVDLLGNEVGKLYDGNKTPGSYEIGFDASQFNNGIYLVELLANGVAVYTKVTVVK